MSKKSNDNLEKFFQKAVRQSDTTFRESDWQKMEKMLDEQPKPAAPLISDTSKRIAGAVAALIILSVSIYFIAFNDQSRTPEQIVSAITPSQTQPGKFDRLNKPHAEPDSGSDQEAKRQPLRSSESNATDPAGRNERKQQRGTTDAVIAQDVLSGPGSSTRENKENKEGGTMSRVIPRDHMVAQRRANGADVKPATKPESSPAAESNENKESSTTAKGIVRDPVSAQRMLNSTDVKPVLKDNELIIVPDTQDRGKQTQTRLGPANNMIDAPAVPLDDRSEELATATEAVTKNESSTNAANNDNTEETKITAIAKKDSLVKKESSDSVDAKESLAESNDPNKGSFLSRWNVALVVAPDFSATSLEKVSAPGAAFGLMIGYNLGSRIAISGGVIRSSKKYNSYGKDYSPPAGYWKAKTNGIVPDEISGRCTIVEVPLLVQFDLKQGSRSRIYVAGGASSYFMLDESYDYTFDQPNDGAAKSWSSTEGRSYVFGVGHISAAYERRIGRGLSLGVEPYVKIPFQGIGWSKVNLFTTGLYVNARYRFQSKSK